MLPKAGDTVGMARKAVSIGGIHREAGEEEEGVLQLLGGLRMMLPRGGCLWQG